MEWDVPEHLYFEKSNDWYASVILIAGALITLLIIYGNLVLVSLVIVGTAAALIVTSRKPEMMHVAVGGRGINAGNTHYPYASLDAFAVVEHPMEHKILLESTRHFMPLIVIPIAEGMDLDAIRHELVKHVPEKDLRESWLHLLLERYGF